MNIYSIKVRDVKLCYSVEAETAEDALTILRVNQGHSVNDVELIEAMDE